MGVEEGLEAGPVLELIVGGRGRWGRVTGKSVAVEVTAEDGCVKESTYPLAVLCIEWAEKMSFGCA